MEKSRKGFTLRSKLIGIIALALFWIILLLTIAKINYGRIELSSYDKETVLTDSSHAQSEISNLAHQIQQLRLLEKETIRHWNQESRDKTLSAITRAKSAIADGSRLPELQSTFSNYIKQYNTAVETHDARVKAGSTMAEPLAKVETNVKKIIEVLEIAQSEKQMEGEDLSNNEREMLNIAQQCSIIALKLQVVQQQFLLSGDKKYLAEIGKIMKSQQAMAINSLVSFAKIIKDGDISKAANSVPQAIKDFQSRGGKVSELFLSENQSIDLLEIKGKAVLSSVADIANSIKLAASKEVYAAQEKLDSTRSSAIAMIVIIVILGTIIFITVSALINRSILKPIRNAVDIADSVKSGDLSKRVEIRTNDEIGKLGEALNSMVESLLDKAELAEKIADGDLTYFINFSSEHDRLGMSLKKMRSNLNELIGQINGASYLVNTGAEQISSASQALSQGATESAASLEEITSSMTEIGGQSKQNAENALTANTLAASARDAASKGTESMRAMTGSMADINNSSQEISKIIKVIDDIAFQTNLLALNAAVEAARAGRHGKGFAVVAEEVRNLAARSAKAAQETSTLIESSTARVKSGTEIAEQTSKALSEIVDEITKAADLVGEIAAASNEQAQGVAQVSQGLSQIDSVTQQNTANAEETASASQDLSSQAQTLQQLLSKFKLKNMDNNISTSDASPEPVPEAPALPHPQTGKWGGVPDTSDSDKLIAPQAQIKLDDEEFGKY
ncbi:MAG: methyl-accepting chemotaxis protein [Planctomycetota bacterium]|jgi:methyl-accepting chemotaxis protein